MADRGPNPSKEGGVETSKSIAKVVWLPTLRKRACPGKGHLLVPMLMSVQNTSVQVEVSRRKKARKGVRET